MTFDFAADWTETTSPTAEYSRAPVSVAVSPLAPPLPCAPTPPSMAEVAALVEELFAEGSLSYEQLRSLSSIPELNDLLGAALAGVPAGRRLTRPRR